MAFLGSLSNAVISFLQRPLVLFLGGLVTCYVIGKGIYNAFLHPLSRFPGPRTWGASRFPYGYHFTRGGLHEAIKHLHEKYGPVVRIAPDELSFITDAAWSDIYTGQNGNKGFPKHEVYHSVQTFESIVDAPDESHTRLRKLLKTGFFSQRNARVQERAVQVYIDRLIDKLRTHHAQPAKTDSEKPTEIRPADMRDWYNWTSLDIIGSIALSEDFGCLENRADHPWLLMVQTHLWLSTILVQLRYYPPLPELLGRIAPKQLLSLQDTFINEIRFKVKRRCEKTLPEGESDFISTALREGQDEDYDPSVPPLTQPELEANCLLMMLAGSETVATSLLASTHLLCERPAVLRQLTAEIRSVARLESEIDFDVATSKMPYLNAVLRESHRLCPPLANGPARITGKDGAIIAGYAVPAGTAVGVTQWAANRVSMNFTRAEEFLPERWLPAELLSKYAADDEQFHKDYFAQDVRDVVRPFSTGGRDCIGQNIAWMEYRLLLARVLWNFDIEAYRPDENDKAKVPSFRKWTDQKAFIIWQKDPYCILLKEAAR